MQVNAMETVNNPDGKYVVIQNGQRVTAPTGNLDEAQREADRHNKLSESSGQPVPEAKRAAVKTNIMG